MVLAVSEFATIAGAVVVAMIAAAGTIVSPLLLANRLAKQRAEEKAEELERQAALDAASERKRRDERLEDLERQEAVRLQVEEAALLAQKAAANLAASNERSIAAQQEVARAAATAARVLAQRTDEVAALTTAAATEARDAATALIDVTRDAAERTNGKLDVIHTLVNSNMTAAMAVALRALRSSLVSLRALLAWKEQAAPSVQPTADELAEVEATLSAIAELEVVLRERRTQTQVAEAQIEQGAGGQIKAEWKPEEPA